MVKTVIEKTTHPATRTGTSHRILEHVRKFGVTGIDAVHRLFYPDKSKEAARIALYRLTHRELLSRFELKNRSFYQLTKKGCAQIGASKSAADPLGPQGLIDRYAYLWFILGNPKKRRALTPQALLQLFPELTGAKGIELQRYYIDEEGECPRLGRVTIDYGRESASLVKKCRGIMRDAMSSPKSGVTSLAESLFA
jgi:hypothetical protein